MVSQGENCPGSRGKILNSLVRKIKKILGSAVDSYCIIRQNNVFRYKYFIHHDIFKPSTFSHLPDFEVSGSVYQRLTVHEE